MWFAGGSHKPRKITGKDGTRTQFEILGAYHFFPRRENQLRTKLMDTISIKQKHLYWSLGLTTPRGLPFFSRMGISTRQTSTMKTRWHPTKEPTMTIRDTTKIIPKDSIATA
jgi:hypothetical protein